MLFSMHSNMRLPLLWKNPHPDRKTPLRANVLLKALSHKSIDVNAPPLHGTEVSIPLLHLSLIPVFSIEKERLRHPYPAPTAGPVEKFHEVFCVSLPKKK